MTEMEAIEFYADTDTSVEMGVGKHKQSVPVRYLNDADYDDLLRLLYAGFKAFRNRKSEPNAIEKAAIKHHVYALVSSALSNPDEDRTISIGFLRSCPPPQIPVALRAVFEGNRDELIAVWQMVPESFRKQLGDQRKGLFGKLGEILKSGANLNQMIDDLSGALKEVAERAKVIDPDPVDALPETSPAVAEIVKPRRKNPPDAA